MCALRYLDSILPSETDEKKACATIIGAARFITWQSVALVESGLANASKNNTEETHRHGVGMAHVVGMTRAGQQCYTYNGLFDLAKCEGEPPRIRRQKGCSNMINLLDVIRSFKTVTVPAVKNVQGKAVKGSGMWIANI